MSKPKYSIEQVNVGDEITYNERHRNLDNELPHWIVVAKIDKSILLIEMKDSGSSEKRMIEIEEVKELFLQNA